MGSAREEILARVRAARPAGPAGDVHVPRDYERARDFPDIVGLFGQRASEYRAIVRRGSVADGSLLAGCLEARGVSTMVVPAGVPESWLVPGVTWLADDPVLSLSTVDQADGVLTGCALAIAETGTIVLDAGPTQGRRMLSLVPDYHLCVVHEDQVVAGVPQAIARLDPRRPLTFISGPSATSDIEFDRVEGVHGPRTLEILLVSGDTSR